MNDCISVSRTTLGVSFLIRPLTVGVTLPRKSLTVGAHAHTHGAAVPCALHLSPLQWM